MVSCLCSKGSGNAVEGEERSVDGTSSDIIQFTNSHAVLDSGTGELQGLYTSRDQIVGGFLTKLDGFAKTIAFEFNKVYSQGQGQVGFKQLTSQSAVADPTAALDAAGLPFTPQSGNFEIIVRTKNDDPNQQSLPKTTRIDIDLDGIDGDTTLKDLAKQLNDLDGISASVTPAGKLLIKQDSPDIDFAFSGDNSGVLAALGINTFFTGASAATLGVNDELMGIDNASKFAASTGGIGHDSQNAVTLAGLLDQPLDSNDGTSLSDQYTQIINQVTQGSSVSQSVADGYQHVRKLARRPAAGGERRQHRRRSSQHDDAAANLSSVGEVYFDYLRSVGRTDEDVSRG